MLFKLFIYLFPFFLSGKNAIFEAPGYVKKKYNFFFQNLSSGRPYFGRFIMKILPCIFENTSQIQVFCLYLLQLVQIWYWEDLETDRFGIGSKLLLVPCWWKGTDPALGRNGTSTVQSKDFLLCGYRKAHTDSLFLAINICVILSLVLRI